MVTLLLAQSFDTISYHYSSGLLLGILGWVTIYIVHNIDRLIEKIMVKSSRSVFFINVLISFSVTALMFAIVTWLLNVILRGIWTLNFAYFRDQLILINYLSILLLAYYTISYFSKSLELHNKKLKTENLEMSAALNKYISRIPSLSNKKTVLIPVQNIMFFKIEDGVVFSYTIEDKKYPLTITTLSELESKLNPSVFFRINRSEIVHVDKVSSYEPYFKDRLAIKFKNNKTTLYTSNNRSAPFRAWLTNTVK